MIKPISAAAFLLLSTLSISSQADVEPGVYLGIDSNTSLIGTAKTEYKSSGREEKDDIDTTGLGLFLGFRFDTNNRFQISRSVIKATYDSDDEAKFHGTDFDWHYVYGDDKVLPYWGLGFGLYNYEDSGNVFTSDEDLSGFSFQLLAGIKLDLHKHFELDVSYRIKSIAWQDIEIEASNGLFTANETISLSHTMSSLNLGAAIKF